MYWSGLPTPDVPKTGLPSPSLLGSGVSRSVNLGKVKHGRLAIRDIRKSQIIYFSNFLFTVHLKYIQDER